MDQKTSIIKFDEACYLKSTLLPDDAVEMVVLTPGSAGFSGRIDKNDVADIQAKMAGKFDNVWEMAKQALTKQSERYSLCLEEESLVVRKVGGKARMRIAAFNLKPLPSADRAQAEIINFLLESSTTASQALAETRQALAKKSEDLEAMQGVVQKANECQREAKALLLSEFAVVLNEKKKMIRELEAGRGRHVSSDLEEEEVNSDIDFKDSTSNDSDTMYEEQENRGEKRKSETNLTGAREKCAKTEEANDSLEDDLFKNLD